MTRFWDGNTRPSARPSSTLLLAGSVTHCRGRSQGKPFQYPPHSSNNQGAGLPNKPHPSRTKENPTPLPQMFAPTPCLEPDCPDYATYKGRCSKHQKQWQGSTRKARLPKDWPTRRLIVLKRDNGICHICGNAGADTIDHIIQGDDHSLGNLAPVHDRTEPHCHRYKTTQEAHQAKALNRIKRKH